MKSLLIKNARLINPSKNQNDFFDILIENKKFAAIETKGVIPDSKATEVIDAEGCWLVPGLIDIHVHLREPGLEYKETISTGTLAAVAGGFTSVACMANTQPVNDNPYITSFILEKARAAGNCNVYPVGAISKGLLGHELSEIRSMIEAGAVAISDDGMAVMNSLLMRKAMEFAKSLDIPVISHAEDMNLVAGGVVNESALSFKLGLKGNPSAAEEIMVAREIALCRLTRAKTHIAHISTAIGLEHIKRAKEQGLPVTAEASPHHLLLDESCVEDYDTNYKMAPPLRSKQDIQALCNGIQSGLIEIIATDHAPHDELNKMTEFESAANGIIGLQTAVSSTMQLVHDNKISLNNWVACFTTGPAKLLKLKAGTIEIGYDADFTIIHPTKKWTFDKNLVLSKSANSPFIDQTFKGKVTHTFVNGELKFSDPTKGVP